MSRQTIVEFTKLIREQLQKVEDKADYSYLELSEINSLENLEQKLLDEACCQDPFNELHEIIYDEIARGHLAKVKIAVNELLKFYLRTIRPENEDTSTKRYLEAIEQIFKGCSSTSFPFQEELWSYLNHALKTAGLYLLDKDYPKGVKHILESLFTMGKVAAQKGLPTTTTQSCLRILEVNAIESNWPEGASKAKNFRFNLETC